MSTDTLTLTNARDLLAGAGISATEVDTCSDTDCRWCDPQPLQLAA